MRMVMIEWTKYQYVCMYVCIKGHAWKRRMWQRNRAHSQEMRTKGSEGWLTKPGVSKWKSLVSAVDVCRCLRLQALLGLTGHPEHHSALMAYICLARTYCMIYLSFLHCLPLYFSLFPFGLNSFFSLCFSPHNVFPIKLFSPSLSLYLCVPFPLVSCLLKM